tara:strand:+ start:21740 stop:22369 length:630 start_codon:yes stop_codon:yes gene_type:complete
MGFTANRLESLLFLSLNQSVGDILMAWTDERVAVLKKMWGEGKTAAEIAKELGEGVTRNAVIGKAHRLKLSGRASPIQTPKKTTIKAAKEQGNAKARVKAPKAEVTEKPKPVVKRAPSVSSAQAKLEIEAIKNKGKRLPLAELTERMCRWPIGDPNDADFGFCGCRTEVGLPYCVEHGQIAYQTTTRSRNFRIDDFVDADKNVKKIASA